MAAKNDNFAIAASQLRDLNRRAYFATLVLPVARRHHVQALYGFGAEIEAVRSRVIEPVAGEIRLRWWRDILEGQGQGGSGDDGSPLVGALLQTLADCGLDAGPLCRLIEARRFDLYRDPMPDLGSFEGYAGETVSVLLHMASTILHGASPPGSPEVAGHLGVALALTDELNRFGFNLSRGHVRLPLEVFAAENISENELLAGTDDERTARAVARLARVARDHLTSAENALASVPRPARLAFAPMANLRADLRRLEVPDRPVLAPLREAPEWMDIARMAVWAWRPHRTT
jgi:15-cis-phytoene synthase